MSQLHRILVAEMEVGLSFQSDIFPTKFVKVQEAMLIDEQWSSPSLVGMAAVDMVVPD